MANEQDRANLSIRRGKLAAGIPDQSARSQYIAAQGKAEASGDTASQAKLESDTSKTENTGAIGVQAGVEADSTQRSATPPMGILGTTGGSKAIGSFKKGGKVKKTGLYKLHKNEIVVPANKASTMKDILSGKKSATKKKIKKVDLTKSFTKKGSKPSVAMKA
jgi:hypothetical protein